MKPHQNNRKRGGQARPWWLPSKTQAQARRQAYKETRPEYLPVKRQLHGEIRASQARTKDVGNWWNEYLNTVSGQQAKTAQGYADAASQAKGLIDQSSALDNANTQRLGEEAAQSAAIRGIAPSSQPAERAAAAQAQRNILASAAGGATAERGANQYAYLGEQQRIGAGQRVKSMLDEASRTRGIKQDLLAAKKEQGAQAAKNFREGQDSAREFHLKEKAFSTPTPYDKALSQQSRLGFKGTVVSARAQKAVAKAYAHAKERGATAQEAAAAAAAAAKRRSAKAQEHVAHTYSGAKNKGGYTVRQAAGFLRQAHDANGNPLQFHGPGQAVDYLINRGVDPAVAKQAVNHVLR